MKNVEEMLSGLYEPVKKAATKVLWELNDKGTSCVIFSAYRSIEEQQKLYDLGRTVKNPDGLTDSRPMGNIVTNARPGNSYHSYGLAIDFSRLDKNGIPTWNLPALPIAQIGKKYGFEWGGDWKSFKDAWHLQMSFGLKIAEIKKIVAAGGLLGLWKRLDEIRTKTK